MGAYARQAKSATKLLKKAGTLITFTGKTTRTFNPITQALTEATTTLRMYGVGIAPGRSAEHRVGTLEGRNIIEFHLAPNEGQTPEPGFKVNWGGADWTVIWVSVLDPAGDGAPYCSAYAER